MELDTEAPSCEDIDAMSRGSVIRRSARAGVSPLFSVSYANTSGMNSEFESALSAFTAQSNQHSLENEGSIVSHNKALDPVQTYASRGCPK